MNRRFPIDPVTHARVLANNAEQVAQDVHRTAAAVNSIAENVRAIHGVVSPLVEWLKSK
ncbi:hypothetical protein [Arthrobacter humicola]